MKKKNEDAQISPYAPKNQVNIYKKNVSLWYICYDSNIQFYWGYIIAFIYLYKKSFGTIYKLIIDVNDSQLKLSFLTLVFGIHRWSQSSFGKKSQL